MQENTKFADYLLYIAYLNKKLAGFFEEQAPYIFCQKGCSKCCKNGEYPFSKMEFNFLMIGFSKLPEETKQIILKKVEKLKEEKAKIFYCHSEAKRNEILRYAQNDVKTEESHKKEFKNSKFEFTYECPFLINDECSVYDFRGIICRSFGLMSINPDGNSKIPFCAFEGLNYSNVVEPETKIISSEKYYKLGDNVPEPLAYNVGYKFLTSKNVEENFHINFGEKKALINWFE